MRESAAGSGWMPDHDGGLRGSVEQAGREEDIRTATFMQQLHALFIRNVTLKKRDRRRTVLECVMPLYWMLILVIMRVSIPNTVYEPVQSPHGQATLMTSLTALANLTLHVAPDNEEVRNVTGEVTDLSSQYGAELFLQYYATKEDLESVIQNNHSIDVAVVFSKDPLSNKSYTLRFNPMTSRLLPKTSSRMSGASECREEDPELGLQMGSCSANGYFFTGFSALQTIIDVAITRLSTWPEVEVPTVVLQNFPRPSLTIDYGAQSLRVIVPLYMVFAWAQFIMYMMMLVVEEKEKKIKQSMTMMGLRDSVYWLSWFSVYAVYVLVLSAVSTTLLTVSKIFMHANVFLLFLLFILYGCSSIMFGFMLTPFFNKSKVAGICGNMIQIALSMMFFLQLYLGDQIPSGVFWALALFSPCAFSFAIDKVLMFDMTSTGLGFGNIWEGPGLPVAGSLIMITVDIFLYLFLAFYMDNIVPSEYGTKRKPWFIFQKSFWVQRQERIHQSPSSATNSAFEGDEIPPDPDVEPVSREVTGKPAVRIRNMKKTFYPRGREPVRAVQDFSLDIYEGQITCILGHNGAGKTTLFNILTGMTNPTEGAATVFGMDISDLNDLTEIRRITGICPQHDIIFANLTPMEHLRFFATLRGVPASRLQSEVEQTLKEVFLYDKRDTRSSDLSGGQKRKLSIGIALIGDPKIIFLDEPTAGVDAYSRRKLWSLLKNRKEGKVILLTTHFMDEADILSDRKAIMSHGRLRCCGSSLFLKNRFGLGYHLTLVVRENTESEAVGKVLQEAVPQAQLARYYGKEMSFLLPSDSSPQFPTLFKQLDESINDEERNIGIEGYGVSMTSLEEVFLALSEEKEEDLEAADNLGERKPSVASSSSSSSSSSSTKKTQEWRTNNNSGFVIESVDVERTKKRAFMALVKMRLTVLVREPTAIFFLALVPLGLVCGSIALSNAQMMKQQQPTDTSLSLTPDVYRYGNFGALLHNDTGHTLSSLEAVLTSANMPVASYSGNYSEIVETQDNMAAFDVASFPLAEAATVLTLGFNDSYVHAIPILVNLLSNAILSSVQDGVSINTSTWMLPDTTVEMNFDGQAFSAPFMIGFAFTLIPAALTIDLVYDREIKAKSMLRLNGVGFQLYFSSYLLVLSVPYLVSYCGMLIIIAAFGVKSLACPPAFATVAILYALFMPCAMLSSAVMSYMFNKAETARQFYPTMATMLGMATYTIVAITDMLVTTDGVRVSLILHIVIAILCPFYIPFGLLYFISKVYQIAYYTQNGVECDEFTVNDYLTTEIIVLYVVTILNTPLYYLLLKVVDTVKLGGNWRSALKMQSSSVHSSPSDWDAGDMTIPEGEDEDVTQVRNNVASVLGRHPPPSPLLIYDLGKVYKKGDERSNTCKKQKESTSFTALRSVSLEVKSGEVFGLLGPNGAGKTTSLRIMTAEEQASKGKVQLCGEDIVSSLSSVFQVLGYCPQHDALWANTTVAEHIQCYAEIRGVKKDQVKRLVDTYLKGLEIEEHKNKKTKNCSGGTKRKLSYILSMLGKPQVVLLDEPSTGMDPKSKRFLWNSILSSFKGERSAILTTHSMEEADALCSAIGILVRGSMRCIGPVQHLKNKYGGGYSLEVKVRQARKTSLAVRSVQASGSSTHASNDNAMEEVQARLKKTLPNAVLDEQFGERLVYKVPQADVKSLVLIFQVLENAKSEVLLDEYALSQTTLEHVFLQFARQQEIEDGEGNGEEATADQQDYAIEILS